MERNIDLIGQTFVESAQQRTSTCQINTIAYDIGIQFGRCIFQRTQDSRFNLCNAFFQTVSDFLIANRNFHRQCRDTVRSTYDIIFRSLITQISQSSTYMNFDTLSHTFADLYIMLTAHIFLNIGSQVISGNTDRVIGNNTAQ